VGAFLVNTLLPSMCRHCGRVVGGGEWEPLLCAACGNEFPFHDAAIPELLPVSQAHALATFDGPARRLLIDLKYDGLLRAGRAIGSRMADAPGARALLDDARILVPVPLHWSRRWWRGHNQAAVLARGVRRRRPHLPVCEALRRTRRTPAQVGFERERRLRNVSGAFRLRPRHRDAVRGRVVVLVDDVVTTGATAAAAAAALIEGGAREVRLYVAAWAR
jgi:ComF family protein